MLSTRQEGEELDAGGYLALMRQELELLEIDDCRELNNDLLRIITKLLALPPPRIRRGIQQLRHRIVLVLPGAVNDSIF